MSFEELEHTADVRIRVRAATLETLFSEAARALMMVMYGKVQNGTMTRHIETDAPDLESLVQAFLSEVLFVSEVEGMVVAGADVRISGTHLVADLSGEPFSRDRHLGGREVKGIAMYGLSIVHDHDSYTLEVIFDV